MSKILDRTGTGAALTAAQNDSNLSSLSGINEAVTGTTYTVTIDDQNRTLEFSNVSPIAVTMTDIATIAAALHTDDFKVTLLNVGAGTVTATRGSTDTFLGGGTTLVLLQGEYATIQTDSTLAIWNIIDSGKNLLGITSSVAELNILDGVTSTAAELNILDGVTSTAAELNILDGVTSTAAELNILDGVTATAAELNYTDVTAIGAVEASKAVVVDANKDALGFRKITVVNTAAGYTASFSHSGTTASDAAVYALASGATGATWAGYFENRSSAGYAGYFVTTVAGGVPVYAAAADAADANAVGLFYKGNYLIRLNPRASAAGYANPIVQDNDQVIDNIGVGNAIDTGVLTLAPYATDAVGIRIDSTVDQVQISGTIPSATITSCLGTNLQDYTSVGSFAFLAYISAGGVVTAGTTYAAANLRYVGFLTGYLGNSYHALTSTTFTATVAAGTWKALGTTDTGSASSYPATLFVRVA